MKLKLLASLGVGLLAMNAVSAMADTVVGTYGAPPWGAGGCSWTQTASSGGGGAPQWYTLNCPGASGVVSMMTVGGGSSATCSTTSSVKAGYTLVGSGCSTNVYKVAAVVVTPAQCTSANKGKVYYSGPSYIAQSILQGTQAQNFCGDCKVSTSGGSSYGETQTISCSTTKM